MVAVVSDPGPGSPAPHLACGKTIGYLAGSIKQKPLNHSIQGLKLKSWRCPTLTWGGPTLPSALSVFTSEFEKGSGGSHSLLPPENWFAFSNLDISDIKLSHTCRTSALVLYGQAARAISTG